MRRQPRTSRRPFRSFTLALALALAPAGCTARAGGPAARARVEDRGTYLVQVPENLKPAERLPLVFALSPVADATAMIRVWAAVGERHRWIIAASKEFRNGVAWDTLLPRLEAELADIEARDPVDNSRVVLTGLSGGAMGSHMFASSRPGRLRAVVANTGMMPESLKSDDYPRGKLAVFLASPTDFRYEEMRRDRRFLESHGWTTSWIEFQGGHTLAPPESYEAAAKWLAAHW